MRIAYQGEPGAYSEAAALRFNPNTDTLPLPKFDDVFRAVEAGEVTHGILPIENTIGGSIHQNYDLLLEHELPIVAEVKHPIVHNLLVRKGTGLTDIRRVYSHPQGLAQCEHFLRTLDDVEIVATYDTAGSAKMIAEQGLTDTAAVTITVTDEDERAAELFGLTILERAVQTYAGNTTRFLIISRDPTPLGQPDKTTIVFTVADVPGALFKALSVFALRDIALLKLESRPIPDRPFEYLFYADVAANREDMVCSRALMHLAEFARSLRTLGSYQAWRDRDTG